MPDMICSLVSLPPLEPVLAPLRADGITIRRVNPWERSRLRAFIEQHFSTTWADEIEVAYSQKPITCFVALKDGKEILGFAAYEVTRRNFFGPTGVDPALQGRGIGKALFIASLMGLRELGYAYAIIGGAGPTDFYTRCVGALVVPIDEGRGIYHLAEEPGFAPPGSPPD